MLLLHISIALLSLVWTTYLYFSPSTTKLNGAYTLIAGTLASGTALVITTGAPLLKSCISGLLYLTVVSFGVGMASRKLSANVEPKNLDHS